MIQDRVFPALSVAKYSTEVVPNGNTSPESCDLVIVMAPPELSENCGSNHVTTCCCADVMKVLGDLHLLIEGGSMSVVNYD